MTSLRWIHILLMHAYGGAISLAGAIGHRKAQGWKRMRQGQLIRLRRATEKLGEFEQWHWFHCSSVGEFEQARPVMEKYRQRHPEAPVLLTFFSSSGWDAFQAKPPVWWRSTDVVAALPLDTPRRVRSFLEALTVSGSKAPAVAWLALTKYDVWPELIRALANRGIKKGVFAAHVIEGRWPFRTGGAGHRRAWRQLDFVWTQGEESTAPLDKFGIVPVVFGDPRFDRVVEFVAEAHRTHDEVLEQWVGGRVCLIIGSAWPEEISAALEIWHDELAMIVVPHEWKGSDVTNWKEQWKKKGANPVVWSDYRASNAAAELPPGHVLLVDAMGHLMRLYAHADAAIVGGGFGSGVHNTLEPAVHGLPVWTGPRGTRFREIQAMQELGCLTVCNSEEEMVRDVRTHLANSKELKRKGQLAKEFAESQQGAAEALVEALSSL